METYVKEGFANATGTVKKVRIEIFLLGGFLALFSTVVWSRVVKMAKVKRYKPGRGRMPVHLPDKFVPLFWQDQDHRSNVVKLIERRTAALKADAGIDSIQKELLAQRAVFISLRLETMEVMAAQTGDFDPGVYTQMVNSLHGLLRALGLERKVKRLNLRTYLDGKQR